MSRVGKAALAGYVALGIVTFGHSAGTAQAAEDARYAACMTDPRGICFHDREAAPSGGLIAAALWPLYWSWEAWS